MNFLGIFMIFSFAFQAPPDSGINSKDYKGHDTFNLMAISGAKQEFIMANIGAPGRHSDGGVFAHSEMGQRFQDKNMFIPPPEKLHDHGPKLPFVIVGDEAFALNEYLMKPYPRRNNLNLLERVFNYRLSRARRIVETTFGIISAVWRIFKSPMRTSLALSILIAKACVCLHNFILKFDPLRRRIINAAKSQEAYENCFQDLLPAEENVILRGAAKTRQDFANYFMTEGAISF